MISYEELSLVFDMDNPLTLEYFELCDKDTDESKYFHKHHILPKSVWKQYDKCTWNKVKFSYQEHYRAHEILPFICLKLVDNKKMVKAWNLLRSNKEGLCVDAIMYEALHKQFKDNMSGQNNPMFGVDVSEETRLKLRMSRLGEKNPQFGKSTNLGRVFGPEFKEKMRLIKTPKPEEFYEYLSTTKYSLVEPYVTMMTTTKFWCGNPSHPPFLRHPSHFKEGRRCTLCKAEERKNNAA